MSKTNQHACVIGAQGKYIELVLVLSATNMETGQNEEQIQHYTLREGESLVYTAPPTKKSHAGAVGYLAPVWDGQWTEGATAAETQHWELKNPAPPTPPKGQMEIMQDTLDLLVISSLGVV